VTGPAQERAGEVSKARRRQLEKRAAGLCVSCGQVPIAAGSKNYCSRCRKKNRLRARAAMGCRPWRPGGPGRIPDEARIRSLDSPPEKEAT
jgi:tRNA(Ile2) C34 agmatinyltransferase TiaS